MVEVAVLVAGVTVTARSDEQSRAPFLVVYDFPITAIDALLVFDFDS